MCGMKLLINSTLQRCSRWSLWMDKRFHSTLHWACDYFSLLGVKLTQVNKRGPWTFQWLCARFALDFVVVYFYPYPSRLLYWLLMGEWHDYRNKKSKQTKTKPIKWKFTDFVTITVSAICIEHNHRWNQSWRHQMETLSALLALCGGIQRSPANSPHKGQWSGALMLSLICAWINSWVNNREATSDLRRHRAHYDVIVMSHLMLNIIEIIG